MIVNTAIYTHCQPSNDMLSIIKQATQGDTIITNMTLPYVHTRYMYAQKNKGAGALWSESTQSTHMISMDDYPFDWMLPIAKPAGLITALAKDSDRILLMFPKNTTIPSIYIFLAMTQNNIVRVYQGATPISVTMADVANQHTKEQYDTLVLPTLDPIPIPTTLLQTPNGSTLRPYQQQMVNFGLCRPYTGWFVDMGLGKTLATLVLIDEWIKHKEIDNTKPILIVAPIMVALDTWQREVTKWGYDWNVKINIRLGPKKREKLLQSLLLPQPKTTLFLTNPEQLEAIRKYYYSYNNPLPFEVLIIDELSMFKSPATKRNATIQYYRLNAIKVLGLTGTPASNHLLNIWNQIKIIDKENTTWAKSTIYEFQDAYFLPVSYTQQGFVRKWKPKMGAENLIYRNLSRNVISMQSEGLIELPAISYTTLHITLPPKALTAYETLSTEVQETLDAGQSTTYTTEDGYELRLPNSDVLRAKLLQIAGGALYTDTSTHTYTVYHDEKLEALDEIIETATSPILLAYYFQSDIKRIQAKYKNTIPILDTKDGNVQATIELWNAGEIPVLLAHPASVGHGLNLQDGGHTLVWFALPNWNNDQYQQMIKRLYRSGQTHPVSVIHLIAKNTIEEIMMQSFRAKTKVNSDMMAALDTMERI